MDKQVDRGIRPVPLKNYYLPGDLENQTDGLVDHYNNHCYHESLNNVTPAGYVGRQDEV